MAGESQSNEQSQIEFIAALQRADKLIRWMSSYIGNMAPGDYAACYADLNEHGMFMNRLDRGVANEPTV
jgi:hypothetical protein